jgi:hypothetical protein
VQRGKLIDCKSREFEIIKIWQIAFKKRFYGKAKIIHKRYAGVAYYKQAE